MPRPSTGQRFKAPNRPRRKSLLGGVFRQGDRARVRRGCFRRAAQASQEVGADGVKKVVHRDLCGIDEAQRRFRSLDFRHRDGAVQRDDRVRVELQEMVVESNDLRPVGGRRRARLAVHGLDRGLDLVGARRVPSQAGAHERLAFRDEPRIPPLAVLVGQRHEGAVGARAGRSPRFGEKHEREQTHHFRLAGHELGEQARRGASPRRRDRPG